MPHYDVFCRREVSYDEAVTVRVFARSDKEANRLAKVAANESTDWHRSGKFGYGNAAIAEAAIVGAKVEPETHPDGDAEAALGAPPSLRLIAAE